MLRLIRWAGWLLGRFVLALRYSVTVKGKKEVLAKPGPYLILPNHVGFTDPPNVYVHLWPLFDCRPVANEVNFGDPVLGTIAAIMRTIKVPDMERSMRTRPSGRPTPPAASPTR